MPWTSPSTRATGYTVTADNWNELVNNQLYVEAVAYVEFTSDVSVTGTSFVNIVSSGAIDYEAVPHLIQFYAVRATIGASNTMSLNLRDGTTDLGRLVNFAASQDQRPISCFHRLTPTAASHTYQISAQNAASQTSTIGAGAGGAGNNMPGFIRIVRLPT